MKLLYFLSLFILIFCLTTTTTAAETLFKRLEKFPQWESLAPVEIATGDLIYPDWMAGIWEVTSILTEQVAPLAPEIVTPGFTGNQKYLNQPIKFKVKFEHKYTATAAKSPVPVIIKNQLPVVADRAFNGLNIATAYLGNDAVLNVKVAPENPNRQITFLRGERQLISTVTGRKSETPTTDKFIATEVNQQLFRGSDPIYLNEVETTTAYQLLKSGNIEADQITAIYLSPQDPNYFTAAGHPVALYRYHLFLEKIRDN